MTGVSLPRWLTACHDALGAQHERHNGYDNESADVAHALGAAHRLEQPYVIRTSPARQERD